MAATPATIATYSSKLDVVMMMTSTLLYGDEALFPECLLQFLDFFFQGGDRCQNGLLINGLLAPLEVFQEIGGFDGDQLYQTVSDGIRFIHKISIPQA